ncbi:MAG: lysophospholipid acyltransferase family protein [Balneolaceae bacterium]|nr:lysophospholipid acyltransferase family protein [Balneolaceae bacterium]
MDAVKSALIWFGVLMLVLLWLPLLAISRLIDRDPAHYYTGRLFRKLGKAISRINPNWGITISGRLDVNDRNPYIMVCNHLSQADIPLISNLPWEMKWVAKKELFDLPVVGWLMKLAGDIPVDRNALMKKRNTLEKAGEYLSRECSVMFFPEGTRSRNGRLNRFSRGAFQLAVTNQVPVLPMVIDGTQNCLPKKSWKFGYAPDIRLKILDPIPTETFSEDEADKLMEATRSRIRQQLMEWRGEPADKVDNYLS